MSASVNDSWIGRILAPDARVAQVLLTIYQHVQASSLMLVTLLPALAFHVLVGWQPTHLAIWLGVISMLTAGPGLFALFSVTADFLAICAYPGSGFKRFFQAFARGAIALWQWWLTAGMLGLLMAYNLALYGQSDGVFMAVLAGIALLAAVSVGLSCSQLQAPQRRWLATVARLGSSVARRPHALLTWLFLIVITVAAVWIPVIGPSMPLIAPALAAMTALLVNGATGFHAMMTEETEAQ